jgi:prepilin-type processing-associated H-X9-DG protein
MLELIPSEETPIRLSLGASSTPNAESILDSMDRLRSSGLEMARENVTMQLQQNEEVSDAIKEAIRKYSDRVQGMVNEETLWSLQGERVEFNMESSMVANYSTIGVLTGLLLPAVQSARDAARRMSSSNNMKQILLAMHNYHAALNRFPARVSAAPDGSPLHSWRVQLLPFLEEVDLYSQFRMNEPWDSPHNIELMERMPAIYRSPQAEAPPGHTVYLAPFGTDTGWPEKGLRISDILDGTSNTIGVVEVTPELAVPWTMPDDLDLDQNPAGEWISPRGANIGMFDGSVQRISPSVSADVLRALFTPKGAEAIPFPR